MVKLVGPGVNDGIVIELIHGRHDAVLEFLLGCDADVAHHRAGKLGEEALDEVEPGAVLGREDNFETAGRLTGEPSLCLLGDVGGMIARRRPATAFIPVSESNGKATSEATENESNPYEWFH